MTRRDDRPPGVGGAVLGAAVAAGAVDVGAVAVDAEEAGAVAAGAVEADAVTADAGDADAVAAGAVEADAVDAVPEDAVEGDTTEVETLRREAAVLREEVAGLRRALESYPTIDMARGIIMATVPCAKEQAWQALVEVSQHTNIKLRDVARHIVAGVAGDPVPRPVGVALATVLGRMRAERH